MTALAPVRARARDMYRTGRSIHAIAAELDIAADTAQRAVSDLVADRQSAAEALRDRARMLDDGTRSAASIARELGEKPETVRGWLRHGKVPRGWSPRQWDRDRIVEKMHEWEALHGQPPVSKDWCPPPRGAGWPSMSTVIRVCGSWNAAKRAAGYATLPPGVAPQARARADALRRQARELRAEGLSYHAIAERLSVRYDRAWKLVNAGPRRG